MADLAEEVDKAFSTKPCYGMSQIIGTKQKEREENDIPKKCLMWSKERYEGADSHRPTFCQECDKSLSEIKIAEILEKEIEVKQSHIEPKNEEIEHYLENTTEGEFINDCFIKEEDYDADAAWNNMMSENAGGLGETEIKLDVNIREKNAEAGIMASKRTGNVSRSQRYRPKRKREIHSPEPCSDCGEKLATPALLRDHCKFFNHGLKYVCEFCNERFSRTLDKKRHITQEHSKMTRFGRGKWHYKCPLCNQSFGVKQSSGSDKFAFWEHLRLSHIEESVNCEVESCNYTCLGQQLLTIHNLTKHKEHQGNASHNNFTCEICGRKVSLAHALAHYRNYHYISLDDGRRTECGHCGEIFRSERARSIHINEAHLKISYDCEQCGKSFKRSIEQLRQHIQKVHMKQSQKKQCQICGEWLSNAENLSNHVREKHTGEKPFKCLFCGESFFSARNVQWHKRYLHPDSYEADNQRKIWINENPTKDVSEYKMKCCFCSEVRVTISDLRQHWAEAHPGQADLPGALKRFEVICELCGDAKPSHALLKIHTFEKHEVDKADCPLCPQKFSAREEAMKHIKDKHKPNNQDYPSKTKREVCPQCGYTGTPGNMKVHVSRMHEKESIRPTACTYCNKEFSTFNSMTKHRKIAHRVQWNIDKARIMVKEGSYADTRDYLKQSQERKKQVKKSPCATCGRVLSSRQQLHLHMKALHGTGLPDYNTRKGARPK